MVEKKFSRKMALYKYFTSSKLLNPNGSLSNKIPSSTIAFVNSEVTKVYSSQESSGNGKRRGPYSEFTPQMKAQLGKYAAEHGVASTLRRYAKSYPDLKESSVRTWRDAYNKELKIRARSRAELDVITINELPEKKRGRPCLLGEDLDKQVRSYLIALRERGGVVNTAIVLACADGIVKSNDSNLLACNGGHVVFTRSWGKSILRRMGFVKRRASTTAEVMVKNFEEAKAQFLLDVRVNIDMDEIPPDLVINWDQTGIHHIPAGSWTMEKEGTKRVEIVAADDKRQITAVFAGTLTGDFLPPQLIYKGTTPHCLPTVKFPDNWDLTYTNNHWSNEKTMERYLQNILIPYINRKREELKLQSDYPALVIFDKFKGQGTDSIFRLLEENNI